MNSLTRNNELRSNPELLKTLLDISNLVSSTMEIRPLLEAILDKLRNIIEYNNAKIFIFSGNQARIIAHRSVLKPDSEDKYPLPLGIEQIMKKKPVVIDDIYSDEEMALAFRRQMGEYMDTVFRDSRSWMSLPMITKNKVIGVLTLDHSKAGFYKEHHIELGMAFANQAAIEYENAKLYNETAKRADEIKTMFNIQQAITSRLEIDSVLKLIAGEALRLSNSHSTAVFLIDGNDLVLSVFSGVEREDLIGLHFPTASSVFGESLKYKKSIILGKSRFETAEDRRIAEATGMHTCLCVPLFAGSRAAGVIAAFSRHDGEFDSEDERIFNMFAPSAVIGIENARLYLEEKRRHQEDEQRRYVAEGLRDILAVLNSGRSLEEILDFIIREAARLMQTDSAALYRFKSDENVLVPEAACGISHLMPKDTAIEAGSSIIGRALEERKPVVITDISGIKNKLKTEGKEINKTPEKCLLDWLENNCDGIIAVPLICNDENYGVIALYMKKDNEKKKKGITKEEIDLAMTFADQAALAIDNARLRKQAADIAVAAERNRLARDLHDAVTQTLFSASLIAEVLPRIWDKNREEGQKRLEELRQLTRGALAEMRTLLFELRPATLVEAELQDLLKQLSEAITGRARIPVRLIVSGYAKLPTEVKIAFYRIAQEALNNIAKHSGASEASLELRMEMDEKKGTISAGMTVKDNGRGFDPGKLKSGRFGLGIMRERAEAIGAKLNMKSKPGSGTTIEIEWICGK